jgi:hypothetical protein
MCNGCVVGAEHENRSAPAAARIKDPANRFMARPSLKPHVVKENVTCLTLSDLISKHGVKRVDVLQLDAEGYDYRILRQFNFEKFRPFIINFEIVNLRKGELAQCKQILEKHDYLYAKTGYDLLAVALPGDWFF